MGWGSEKKDKEKAEDNAEGEECAEERRERLERGESKHGARPERG
jgi:hypothetical protein